MDKEENTILASRLMLDFAYATGLDGESKPPRRYLWTDAFAVCNFLELYRRSQDESWLDLAKRLVDQVHHVLGRHRPEGPQNGWISGLSEAEGELHPTRGGLRIGKQLKERAPDEPSDERLEWERDGQYYHYLTKWMHALHCVSRVTGDVTYLRWAVELAQTAHASFCYPATPDGSKSLHWKMSTDLTRPLVRSMGQHDPLDGFVVCSELQSAARSFDTEPLPELGREIEELAGMCRGKDLATDDALGVGGMLCDLTTLEQLIIKGDFQDAELFQQIVDAALLSLQAMGGGFLDVQGRYRLAFREFGLSIGLRGFARFAKQVQEYADLFDPKFFSWLLPRMEGLDWYLPLSGKIERFWLEERNQATGNWKEHRDINMVMLATSLAPEEFLRAG